MKPYVMTAGRDKRNVISEGNYLEKLVYQVAIKSFNLLCIYPFKQDINGCCYNNARMFLNLREPWAFALYIKLEVSSKKISLSGTTALKGICSEQVEQ